jgi:pimeloyl-ACP methyl ester carboxylesterase
MKIAKYTVLILIIIWAIAFVAMEFLRIQEKLAFNPSSPIGTFLDRCEFPLKEFMEETPQKNNIHIWAAEGLPGKAVIILSHGRSAHDYTLLPIISTLHSDGNTVLVYSYSGYPPSTGRPSEENFYGDLDTVINFAQANYKVSKKDVILVGHSLGTAVAVGAASKNNFKALILFVPFSNIRDAQVWEAKQRPLLKILSFFPMKYKFDSVSKVSKIKAPFYLFRSEEDSIAPPYMSDKLLKNNNKISLFTYKYGDHRDPQWFIKDLEKLIKKINNM